MGATIEVRQQTTMMIRLVGDKLVREERTANLYVVPPKGEYTFEITGYAEPFQMKRSAQWIKEGESEFQNMTRVELTITEGPGKGKMFDQMWGFALGAGSNLGKFCRRMNISIPAAGSFDLEQIIGYIGTGYVTPSDTLGDDKKPKYANLGIETVSGVSAPERAFFYAGELSDTPASSNGTEAVGEDGWPTG